MGDPESQNSTVEAEPEAQDSTVEAAPEPQDSTVEAAPEPQAPAGAGSATEQELLEEDLLIEEVSIDGMCGVY